jgi:hypothetical protein
LSFASFSQPFPLPSCLSSYNCYQLTTSGDEC